MAGSRVLAQESDAVFTIVEGYSKGERILKPLAFRYSGNDDAEITFSINQNCILEYISSKDFTTNLSVKKKKEDFIHDYFQIHCTATLAELEHYIYENKIMARSTLFRILENFPVEKIDKNTYKYNQCTTAVAL